MPDSRETALRDLLDAVAKPCALVFVLVIALALAATASASKQAVDYFGTPSGSGSLGGEFGSPGGIAVNQTGAGPAAPGDVYVLDPDQNRIQRFARDTHATATPYDDTYPFISAWGADVVSPGGVGDQGDATAADYEICTLASQCQAALASGGNGTLAGDGSLDHPAGIAVDQDTGYVYVSDAGNHRVNVYAGDGAFLRSFGYDVVASGPGNVPAASEKQQLTIDADGGKFSLQFRGQTTGASAEDRIGSIETGSTKIRIAFKAEAIVADSGKFQVGQGISALDGSGQNYLPPGTTITSFELNAEGQPKSFTVSQPDVVDTAQNVFVYLFGHDLPYNASAAEVQSALNALPTIGGAGGSVTVTGSPGGPYTIAFAGAITGADLPPLGVRAENLALASATGTAAVSEITRGGAYEICVAADGDACRAGSAGDGPGEIDSGRGIAVSQPDGNSATATVFLADSGNHRVNTYALDGTSPGSFGSSRFEQSSGNSGVLIQQPQAIAVDSRGIVYASRVGNQDPQVERYDTQNANGAGVGFLAPIRAPGNEIQELGQTATAGQFRLSLDPDGAGPQPPQTTGDLAFDATDGQVQAALAGLPAIGAGNVQVGHFLGNAGVHFYAVEFIGALALTDVEQLLVSDGTTPLTGSIPVQTRRDGHNGPLLKADIKDLAVDPDSDAAGPDSDLLYVSASGVQQFGPANPPGLTAPPLAIDDTHGTSPSVGAAGLAVDSSDGRLYATARSVGSFPEARGVYVLDNAGPAPTASLDSLSDPTCSSLTAHATIDPNGPPLLSYHLEYSLDASHWTSTPDVALGTQEDPQSIDAVLNPPGAGLEPNTLYHVRLSAAKKFAAPVLTAAQEITTLPCPPDVETVGAPLPTPTSAVLSGRVNPRNSATTYHFEYLTEAQFQADGETYGPGTETTEPRPAGAGAQIELVAQSVSALQPETTYHYRLLADNGVSGSPAFGADRTLTTHSATPLTNPDFPHPPGNDRAYEQVSVPDSGGNPSIFAFGFSADGNRAIYQLAGGAPISASGTAFSQLLAERPPGQHPTSGWQPLNITPRSLFEPTAADWVFLPSTDLSRLIGYNEDFIFQANGQIQNLWQITPPAGPYAQLASFGAEKSSGFFDAADDLSRVVTVIKGDLDPAHPAASSVPHLYDISNGSPHLLDFLPDGSVPACGVRSVIFSDASGPYGLNGFSLGKRHWVSGDGARAFFPSQGEGPCGESGAPTQIYMREIDAAQTKPISLLAGGGTIAGPACSAAFIRSTADAAFFWTQSDLDPADSAPASCANGSPSGAPDGDVYRYQLSDASLKCLTCVVAGLDADVSFSDSNGSPSGALADIGVSADGSALYFNSPNRLLPGAAAPGIYRVAVDTGQLHYVAPGNRLPGDGLGTTSALSADGSVLTFLASAPALNPLGGTDNGATLQFYRYDDTDRSLLCVSCPADGSPPRAAVSGIQANGHVSSTLTFNGSPLSADGSVLVFDSPSPLVNADQNTAPAGRDPAGGRDVYEWRGGRALLISDGLTNWPSIGQAPDQAAVSPDGKNVFFFASAQLTPDALDGYHRLYDARLGGGIVFPKQPPPCPLEVCQGTPQGAPEEPPPGTSDFRGPGNPEPEAKPCPKGKHRVHGKCVKKRHHKRAHHRAAGHNRRAGR